MGGPHQVFIDPSCPHPRLLQQRINEEGLVLLKEIPDKSKAYVHVFSLSEDLDDETSDPELSKLIPRKGRQLISESALLSSTGDLLAARIKCFSRFFHGKKICCSGLENELKAAIKLLVCSMGGSYAQTLSKDVTHLVAHSTTTKKYDVALKWGTCEIVMASWVFESFRCGEMASEEEHKVKVLKGMGICVTGVSAEDRGHIQQRVRDHGGDYMSALTKTTTILITAMPPNPNSEKLRYAVAEGIPVVREEWLQAKINQKGAARVYQRFLVVKDQIELLGREGEEEEEEEAEEKGGGRRGEMNNARAVKSACYEEEEEEEEEVSCSKPSCSFQMSGGETITYNDKDDTFLEALFVSLVGLSPPQAERCKKIINAGGGTYLTNQVSKFTTHIVASSLRAVQQAAMAAGYSVNFVGNMAEAPLSPAWLEACYRDRGLASTEDFFIRNRILSRLRRRKTTASSASELVGPSSLSTHSFNTGSVTEKAGGGDGGGGGGSDGRDVIMREVSQIPGSQTRQGDDLSSGLPTPASSMPAWGAGAGAAKEAPPMADTDFSNFLKSLKKKDDGAAGGDAGDTRPLRRGTRLSSHPGAGGCSTAGTLSQRLKAKRLQRSTSLMAEPRTIPVAMGKQSTTLSCNMTAAGGGGKAASSLLLDEKLRQRPRLNRSISLNGTSLKRANSSFGVVGEGGSSRNSLEKQSRRLKEKSSARGSSALSFPPSPSSPSSSSSSSSIFNGLRFALGSISSLTLQQHLALTNQVKCCGGQLVELTKTDAASSSSSSSSSNPLSPADYVICEVWSGSFHRVCREGDERERGEGRTMVPCAVTPEWVVACATQSRLIKPQEDWKRYAARPGPNAGATGPSVLDSRKRAAGGNSKDSSSGSIAEAGSSSISASSSSSGFAKIRISLTGFVKDEREELRRMARVGNIRCTEELRKSHTHLVCRQPKGSKYKRAPEWGVKRVNSMWLVDSVRALRPLPSENYPVLGSQPASSSAPAAPTVVSAAATDDTPTAAAAAAQSHHTRDKIVREQQGGDQTETAAAVSSSSSSSSSSSRKRGAAAVVSQVLLKARGAGCKMTNPRRIKPRLIISSKRSSGEGKEEENETREEEEEDEEEEEEEKHGDAMSADRTSAQDQSGGRKDGDEGGLDDGADDIGNLFERGLNRALSSIGDTDDKRRRQQSSGSQCSKSTLRRKARRTIAPTRVNGGGNDLHRSNVSEDADAKLQHSPSSPSSSSFEPPPICYLTEKAREILRAKKGCYEHFERLCQIVPKMTASVTHLLVGSAFNKSRGVDGGGDDAAARQEAFREVSAGGKENAREDIVVASVSWAMRCVEANRLKRVPERFCFLLGEQHQQHQHQHSKLLTIGKKQPGNTPAESQAATTTTTTTTQVKAKLAASSTATNRRRRPLRSPLSPTPVTTTNSMSSEAVEQPDNGASNFVPARSKKRAGGARVTRRKRFKTWKEIDEEDNSTGLDFDLGSSTGLVGSAGLAADVDEEDEYDREYATHHSQSQPYPSLDGAINAGHTDNEAEDYYGERGGGLGGGGGARKPSKKATRRKKLMMEKRERERKARGKGKVFALYGFGEEGATESGGGGEEDDDDVKNARQLLEGELGAVVVTGKHKIAEGVFDGGLGLAMYVCIRFILRVIEGKDSRYPFLRGGGGAAVWLSVLRERLSNKSSGAIDFVRFLLTIHRGWTHFVAKKLGRSLPVVLAMVTPDVPILTSEFLVECRKTNHLVLDMRPFEWTTAEAASVSQQTIISAVKKWKGSEEAPRVAPFEGWMVYLFSAKKSDKTSFLRAILQQGGATILEEASERMTHYVLISESYSQRSVARQIMGFEVDMIRSSKAAFLRSDYIVDYVLSGGRVDHGRYLIEIDNDDNLEEAKNVEAAQKEASSKRRRRALRRRTRSSKGGGGR
eukprot:jgi/Bigna1/89075/estExt_fgenesh1_pg.C_430056